MKVKIAFTIDIDLDAYQERFWPAEKNLRGRNAIIRDDVKGQAAAAVIHGRLGGHVDEGGCLNGYSVDVWDAEDAQAPTADYG